MNKKISTAIAGLLFSLGGGFVFFALNYEYRHFDIVSPQWQTFYQIFFIAVCFILGVGFIIGGAYLITLINTNEGIDSIDEKRLRQIIQEEVSACLSKKIKSPPKDNKPEGHLDA
jgi:hypothetical protein